MSSSRKGLALAAGTLVLGALSVSSCGKEAEPPAAIVAPEQPAATKESTGTPAIPTPEQVEAVRARRETLAKAYHRHRCVLTGAVLPSSADYPDAAHADTAAFEAAWAAEAAVAPGWAAEAAVASYREGCGAKVDTTDGQQE